jgi:hypothetical protein
MRPSARTLAFTIAVTAAVAFAVSTLTMLAESRLRPSGTFRVVVTGGNPPVKLPHLATFMPDGGVVGSVIPVACLEPGVSMSESHGEWTVKMSRGMPTLHFQMQADLYRQPMSTNDPETSYEGAVVVVGSAPLTFGAVRGEATMTFPPGPCAAQYNGKMEWTATEIEAIPPSK